MAEQAVIVRFDYSGTGLEALHELEDELSVAIDEAGEGEYDGHDVTPDLKKVTLFMYGPDAKLLFGVVRGLLENSEWVWNAVATLRFGPPDDGVEEDVIGLTRRFGESPSD